MRGIYPPHSASPSFPKSLIGNLRFLNTVDPGLKIAGVTRRWESTFLLLLWFLNAFGPLIEAFRGDKQG